MVASGAPQRSNGAGDTGEGGGLAEDVVRLRLCPGARAGHAAGGCEQSEEEEEDGLRHFVLRVFSEMS